MYWDFISTPCGSQSQDCFWEIFFGDLDGKIGPGLCWSWWANMSQMSNGWPFPLLNDEEMSKKVRVEHQPRPNPLTPQRHEYYFARNLDERVVTHDHQCLLGSDPPTRRNYVGATPLSFACMFSQEPAHAKLLLDARASVTRQGKHIFFQRFGSFAYFGLSPLPVTVTTRIITFWVGDPGDPYKPSFATVTGRGDNPTYCIRLQTYANTNTSVDNHPVLEGRWTLKDVRSVIFSSGKRELVGHGWTWFGRFRACWVGSLIVIPSQKLT